MKRAIAFILSLMLAVSVLAQDVFAAIEPSEVLLQGENVEAADGLSQEPTGEQPQLPLDGETQNIQENPAKDPADPQSDEQISLGEDPVALNEEGENPNEKQVADGLNKDVVEDETFQLDVSDENVQLDAVLVENEDEADGFQFKPGYHQIPGEDDVESVKVVGKNAGENRKRGINTDNSLPSSYTTPNLPNLRNQNPYGTCWAHSNMAMAEISMKKQGLAASPDYSEMHLAYFTYHTPTDPTGRMNGDRNWGIYNSDPNFLELGGSLGLSSHVLASWVGAADEFTAPYVVGGDNSYKYTSDASLPRFVSESDAFNDAAHLKNYYKVNSDDRDAIKRIIRDCGAAGISYFALGPGQSAELSNGTTISYGHVYNPDYNCYYCPLSVSTNHAVTIVGWDDNFSSSKFVNQPDGNGAWLIRNSWTTSTTDTQNIRGYFWLSYYDKSIANSAVYGYEYDVSYDYDHNYQYDGCMDSGSYSFTDTVREANVFQVTSSNPEILQAASFCTDSTNLNYQIDVYLNPQATDPSSGTLVSTVSGSTYYAGYYTIPLTKKVTLNPGDSFSIVITFTKEGQTIKIPVELSRSNSDWYGTTAAISRGQSFSQSRVRWSYGDGTYEYDWTDWEDCYDDNDGGHYGNLRIKAFTKDVSIESQRLVAFDANGGSCDTSCVEIIIGGTYPVLPTPTRDGYTFDGWYTLSSGGSMVQAGDAVTTTSNQILYAHWTKLVTVNLNPNITGGNFSITSLQLPAGGKYTGLPTTPSTTPTGYTFEAWYTDPTGGTKITESSDLISTSDHTLYAHWTGSTVRVTLNAKSGTGAPSYINVTYGGTYTGLVNPTRTGYDFNGWWTTDGINGERIYSNSIVRNSQNHTLYANWIAQTYKVTFDAQGGYCSPSYQWYEYNQKYTNLPTPVKDGYSFAGWYTAPTGGTRVTGNTTVLITSDQTLYARWTAYSYTIRFDKNGGSYLSSSSKSVTFGSTYGYLATTSRTGYDFAGWYTSAGDDGVKVESTTVVSTDNLNLNESTHYLYAHWSPIAYTVTFNGNGGTIEEGQETKTVYYQSTYGELPIPVRKGYTFAGWFTTATGTTQVTGSQTYTRTSDQTLYAHWAANSYTIQFDKNGGDSVTTSSKTVTFGNTYGTLATASRPGYDFAGWWTTAEGGTQVTSTTTVTTGNLNPDETTHKLYAHWTPKTYTVRYDKNGGDSVTASSKTVTFASVYGTLATASRTGYDFAGWYTAKNGGVKIESTTFVSTDNLDVNSSTHYLYAHWTPHGYTVSFTGNGGTVPEGEESKTVRYLDSYGTLPTPTRAGYDFNGWYTAQTGGNKITPDTVYRNTTDQTLYAQWLAKTITVDFDPTGGTCAINTTSTVYNATFGTLPVPVRAGYTFVGWFSAAENGTQIHADSNTSAVYTTDILDQQEYRVTIYAHWTPKTYTIALNGNGGTCDIQEMAVTYDSAYGALSVPTRAGYAFDGWYTERYGGIPVAATTIVTADNFDPGAATHTLYAHWATTAYTVTFDGNAGVVADGEETKTVHFMDLYGEMPTPIREDYDFIGWFTAAEGGNHVTAMTQYKTAEDQTLYAHWAASGLWIDGVDAAYDYTGAAIKPPAAVYYRETLLKEKTDYTIAYSNNINAGNSAMITITGKGNYAGTAKKGFSITPLPMDQAVAPDIVLAANNRVQKGKTKVTYTIGTKTVTLVENRDYTLSYDTNPVAPGDYTVTVTGKGNYTGTTSYTETIADAKKLISKVTFTSIPVQTYTDGKAFVLEESQVGDDETRVLKKVGQNYVPLDFVVKIGSTVLRYGEDYELTYANNRNAGTATVTIIGRNGYAGTKSVNFKIDGVALNKTTIPGDLYASTAYRDFYDTKRKGYVYNGMPFCPAGLPAEQEDGNSYGITPVYNYKDPVTRVATSVNLLKGTDYTVAYEKNTEPGTATVIFTGKGRYTGSVKKTFRILARDINASDGAIVVQLPDASGEWKTQSLATEADVPSYNYVKNGVKPEPVILYACEGRAPERLKYGTDYALSWTNHTKLGAYDAKDYRGRNIAPTVTVTFKGRFTGKCERTFTITQGVLNDTVKVNDIIYLKDRTGIYKNAKLTLTDSSGQTLKAGTDYYALNDRNHPITFTFQSFDWGQSSVGQVKVRSGRQWIDQTVREGDPVTDAYCIPAGTCIAVKVTGKGFYEGQTAYGSFCFGLNDFSKITATIPNQQFTGKAITLGSKDITVTLKNGGVTTNLIYGTDYVITSYEQNTNVGTAKVTLKGKAERGYVGEKTFTFKIVAKQLNETVHYYANAGDGNTGLYKALLDANKDPGKELAWYQQNYRVTGTMKDSVIPLGAKLARNAFVVQKYNPVSKRWVNVSAKEISFAGWNTRADGNGYPLGSAFANQAAFNPSWIARQVYGTGWTLYAQWQVH